MGSLHPGVLRAGEMTVPNNQVFDKSVYLTIDIAVDDPKNPSILQLMIKQSKTDPFRSGVDLYVGRTSTKLCALTAMIDYLSKRGMSPGPLYRLKTAEHCHANSLWRQYVKVCEWQASIKTNIVDTASV